MDGSLSIIPTQSTQGGDDSNTCIICSERWKKTGSHRAVSLSCGHLFGKKCIERWIQDRGRKYGAKGISCPMCMKIARLTDIRNVMPSRIAAKDTGISDKLKVELEKKKVQLKEDERLLDNSRLALAVVENQIKSREDKLKQKPEKAIKEPTPLNTQTSTTETTTVNKPVLQRYGIVFSHHLSESRNVSRVFTIDNSRRVAYISFKSAESDHGALKLDPENPKNTEVMSIHTNLIKDIKYNNENGLIMTTGLDKTFKFSSSTTKQVTESISLPLPGWSCCYDPNDEYKALCGLTDGTILIYDRRHTKSFLRKLQSPLISPTPLHSLIVKTVKEETNIYCSNLGQVFSWDAQSECTVLEIDGRADYNPYSLSNHVSSSQDTHLLLSSRNKTSTKHQIIDVGSSALHPSISTTVSTATPQKGIVRSFSFTPHDAAGSPIICYSDEALGSLNLSRDNSSLQHFNIHSCPLDIKLFDDERLAFLTDNRLFLLKPLYKPNQN